MSVFSERLNEILDSRGISKTWLADQVGTSESSISRYTSSIHSPNLAMVIRIADALNVSIDYLAGRSASPAPNQKLEPEVVILCDAYRRADDNRRDIIWAALDPFLTNWEKEFFDSLGQSGNSST